MLVRPTRLVAGEVLVACSLARAPGIQQRAHRIELPLCSGPIAPREDKGPDRVNLEPEEHRGPIVHPVERLPCLVPTLPRDRDRRPGHVEPARGGQAREGRSVVGLDETQPNGRGKVGDWAMVLAEVASRRLRATRRKVLSQQSPVRAAVSVRLQPQAVQSLPHRRLLSAISLCDLSGEPCQLEIASLALEGFVEVIRPVVAFGDVEVECHVPDNVPTEFEPPLESAAPGEYSFCVNQLAVQADRRRIPEWEPRRSGSLHLSGMRRSLHGHCGASRSP